MPGIGGDAGNARELALANVRSRKGGVDGREAEESRPAVIGVARRAPAKAAIGRVSKTGRLPHHRHHHR